MWLPITLWLLVTWLTCLAVAVTVRAAYFPDVPVWRLLRNRWIDGYYRADALRRFDAAIAASLPEEY